MANPKKPNSKVPSNLAQNQSSIPDNKQTEFSDSNVHAEIKEFKTLRTAFSPHPKPIPVSKLKQELLKSFSSVLSKSYLSKEKSSGKNTIVAILDTGVFGEHEDLKGKVIFSTSYKTSKLTKDDTRDLQGHGTHLAGIIAASQSKTEKQVFGIAPNAKIVSIKVTDGKESSTSWWKITEGLEHVIKYNSQNIKNKINAVLIAFNASDNLAEWGQPIRHKLASLINTLYIQKIPVIVSAGNRFEDYAIDGLSYPAHLDNIISVGATYHVNVNGKTNGDLGEFTQRIPIDHKKFKNTFLLAPGVNTISCGISNHQDYTILSGSSMAAASLTAMILLLQEKYFAKYLSYPCIDDLREMLSTEANQIMVIDRRNPSYKKTFRHADILKTLRRI